MRLSIETIKDAIIFILFKYILIIKSIIYNNNNNFILLKVQRSVLLLKQIIYIFKIYI